jgi:hypothetical protein
MSVVVQPPVQLLWIALGIPGGVALFSLLLTRGKPWWARAVPVALAFAAAAFVLILGWHPARFAWNEAGIRDDGFGAPRTIAWGEIQEARRVNGWASSRYRLAIRTNGIAHQKLRGGTFQLADGSSARVFAVPEAPDAIWLRTASGDCVYAPPQFESFAQAVGDHVPLQVDAR